MPQLSLLHVVGKEVKSNMRCSACPLCEDTRLKSNKMDGAGSSVPTYLFAGFAPGWEDDKIGLPMTGENGRLFKQLLKEAGYHPGEYYITNCLKCSTFGRDPHKRWWDACQDWMRQEITNLAPKVVVAMGAKALGMLTDQKGLGKLRRRGLPCVISPGTLVFPVRQPMAIKHAEGQERAALRQEVIDDLKWIREETQAGRIYRAGDIETDYQQARTPEDVDRFFDEIRDASYIAVDLETTALFPDPGEHVVAVGFSTRAGMGRAIPLYAKGLTTPTYWPDGYVEELVLRFRELFKTKHVFGHNFLSFDQKFVRHEFGVDRCKIDFDTMLAHYILNEEPGTHGLEKVALLFTTMPPWKEDVVSIIDDTDRLSQYLCRDVDATWRIREAIEPQLTPQWRWLLDELLIPVSYELCDTEWRGVSVSREKLQELDGYLTRRIQEEETSLRASDAVRRMELADNLEFNPASPDQLRRLMKDFLRLPTVKKTKTGLYSTDAEVLSAHKDTAEIRHIQQLRGLTKLHGTYCTGLEEKIRSDGRVHTSYLIHRTVTGRLASRDPNLQNIPRPDTAGKVLEDGAAIKNVFSASSGCVLMEADYSQIELRVLACLSHDPNMLETYRVGGDIHTATAAVVNGIPDDQVTKAMRSNAKTINFGVAYGMSEETLIHRFQEAGSTEQEANHFLRMHKESFPLVWKFMDDQERIVRRQRYQDNPFGRRRRYSEIDARATRQAYNYLIQSTASDVTLLALVRCCRVLRGLGMGAELVLTVHDSLIFDVPESELEETAHIVRKVMESFEFTWLTVPLVADVEVGQTWGNLKKFQV